MGDGNNFKTLETSINQTFVIDVIHNTSFTFPFPIA